MAAGVWRWWFENRKTGEITIAQAPNWALWSIGAGSLARWALTDGSTTSDVVGWLVRGLWIVWSTDELVRGVNPWRRLLGAAVLAWQTISMIAMIGSPA